MSYLGDREHYPGDLDDPSDWRKVEYALMVTRARDALDRKEWPSWLHAHGTWTHVQLTVDGSPVGPPLAWPNALFIAAWLMYEPRT